MTYIFSLHNFSLRTQWGCLWICLHENKIYLVNTAESPMRAYLTMAVSHHHHLCRLILFMVQIQSYLYWTLCLTEHTLKIEALSQKNKKIKNLYSLFSLPSSDHKEVHFHSVQPFSTPECHLPHMKHNFYIRFLSCTCIRTRESILFQDIFSLFAALPFCLLQIKPRQLDIENLSLR